jgi:hypothetical protein
VVGPCPATTADYTKIENVAVALWVDADTTDKASELDVTTAVFLRNQNEAPTAAATYNPVGSRRVLLNGSGSSDPEGRTLQFYWFEGAAPSAGELSSTGCTADYPSAKWQGVTYNRTFDSTEGAAGTVKDFYLLVRDPGCLVSVTPVLKVTIPT